MLKGLRTVIYPVTDITEAKAWYRALLGQEPYFDQPFYVGFAVGGFELGLDPGSGRAPGADGALAYWGVDSINAAVQRLAELGISEQTPIHDVGDDIRMAVCSDPFGNAIGIIENPHFTVADVR